MWLGVGGLSAIATLGMGIWHSPALADAAGSTSVGDTSEAWYNTSEATICTSAVGCPPVSLPFYSYPANTLHVGVSGGSETSATYLEPDLSAYIGGTLPTAGTMTLPLATVSGNGNSSASTATVEACLSKAVFKDGTQGSTAAPPATDCSVTSKLVYANNSFTLDLGPFLAAWSGGTPDYGVALVPVLTGAGPTTDWQVAFNGRNLAGAPHISSAVTGGSAAAGSSASAFVAPTTGAPTPSAPIGSSPGAATAPAVTPIAPTGATTASGTTGTSPSLAGVNPSTSPSTTLAAPGTGGSAVTGLSSASGSKGFQYPEILLLPLIIAAGMLFVLRLLTSDATPKRLRAR